MQWMMPGSMKPRVLPDPVCAIPTKSWPVRAMENPWDWMGVGAANPARWTWTHLIEMEKMRESSFLTSFMT